MAKRPLDGKVALVGEHGGEGVAVRVDHTQEEEVAALIARIETERGRLDVLVNDIWGGDPVIDWGAKFWKLDIAAVRALVDQAIMSHLITARHVAPLMVRQGSGLIVEVTDGHHDGYRGQLLYDLVKNTVNRLGYAMAWDLHGTGVTALALSPGFLRSEAVLGHFGVSAANWRDGVARDPFFGESETPFFVGRAVAALAADLQAHRKAGQVLFASARLDNLLSAHAGLTALLGRAAAAGTSTNVEMFAAFDHEEIGSASRSGAAGPRQPQTSWGWRSSDASRSISRSGPLPMRAGPRRRGTAPRRSRSPGSRPVCSTGWPREDEMPLTNDADIKALLEATRTIAMVGASDRPDRPSYRVMQTLQAHGYRVIPVNPQITGEHVHGEFVFRDLSQLGDPIDMVDIFRNSAAAGEAVDQAIAAGAKSVWMQLGVVNEEAAARAEAAGLKVVMDRCPAIEIPRLGIGKIA